MASPVFVQGWKGTININGSFFNSLQYSFEEFGDLEDITYTRVGGVTYRVVLPGYPGARGTISFVYDTANQPTISPFDLRFGMFISMVLYPEGTKPYSFSAYTGNFQFSSGPQAGVSVKCSTAFESSGDITFPTS